MSKTANSYILPQGNRTPSCVLTAAKTSYANNTNAVKVFDAGVNDSLLKRAWAVPRDTATASKLQLFSSPDNGTTMYFLDSVLMAAYTNANTTATPITEFTMPTDAKPIYVPAGSSVWAAMGVALANGVIINALVEDY